MIVTDIDFGIEYIHIQLSPSNVWVINHNLNCHPVVTVIDSGNSQVEGDVTYNSLNQITVTFTAGFSGKAILR